MTILIFLIVLMILIFVHELGHFLAAKYFNIRVDEFGIGFPPRLIGKKVGETLYSLNLTPIGGFVRIFGENPDEESIEGPEHSRSFVHQAKWKQAVVLVAGVTFNVLFAWLLFTLGFIFGMPGGVVEADRGDATDVRLLITQVMPDSPAEEAGLASSDEITAVRAGEEEMTGEELSAESVSAFVADHATTSITFDLVRHGEATTTSVTPEMGIVPDDPDRAAIGIVMSLSGIMTLPPHKALWEGGLMTVEFLGAVVVGLGGLLAQAVTLSADLDQVAGPVGIVGLVGDASALGLPFLVTFTAFISLNLAVINLLPFPALDGGRLVFVLIEKLKGSPIKPTIANALNTAGFAALILLIIAVTYNDIVRMVG